MFVDYEVAGRVATVRLNRPPMNAFSAAVQQQLQSVVDELTARTDMGSVVLYGGPQVFAAGADIKEMAPMGPAKIAAWGKPLSATFTAIARLPYPVIAAINGYALGGGCEFALTADFRVAADNAQLGQPEILLGIIPGAGGTQRLARLVGPARAKELIFSGRFVAADEALQIGLVDKVVPAENVYDEALNWARELASGPAQALHAAKRAIDDGLQSTLDAGLQRESELFAELFATKDKEIGFASFLKHGPGKATFEV